MQKRSPLSMARKLEEKADELESQEVELVEELLPRLRVSKKIKPAQAAELERIYEKYFGDDSENDEPEDADDADHRDAAEEEIDDDDFV